MVTDLSQSKGEESQREDTRSERGLSHDVLTKTQTNELILV